MQLFLSEELFCHLVTVTVAAFTSLGAANLVAHTARNRHMTKALHRPDQTHPKNSVVHLVRVVNWLSHCDLLSRCTVCRHRVPWLFIDILPLKEVVHGVVNMDGVVKTLRRSNSLLFLSS